MRRTILSLSLSRPLSAQTFSQVKYIIGCMWDDIGLKYIGHLQNLALLASLVNKPDLQRRFRMNILVLA